MWYTVIKGGGIMSKVYTIDEISKKVKPVAEKYGIEKVWLFGSYARSEADTNSDVDILLDGYSKGGLLEFGRLYNDISVILDKEVDIVDAEDLRRDKSNPLAKQLMHRIKEDRVLIYEKL